MLWIIRILLFPVHIILSILVAFLKFLLGISTFITTHSFITSCMWSCSLLYSKKIGLGIEALIIAFIFSPYGLPLIGASIIGVLEVIKDKIKEI